MSINVMDAVYTDLLNGSGIADIFPAGATLKFYSGSRPAITAAATGTLLGTITLPATPWGTAAAKAIAKNGTWSTTGAAGAGAGTDIGYARLANGADDRRIDFTVGESATDIVFDNSNVATGQACSVTSLSISFP